MEESGEGKEGRRDGEDLSKTRRERERVGGRRRRRGKSEGGWKGRKEGNLSQLGIDIQLYYGKDKSTNEMNTQSFKRSKDD